MAIFDSLAGATNCGVLRVPSLSQVRQHTFVCCLQHHRAGYVSGARADVCHGVLRLEVAVSVLQSFADSAMADRQTETVRTEDQGPHTHRGGSMGGDLRDRFRRYV